jgi:hypothetical protein
LTPRAARHGSARPWPIYPALNLAPGFHTASGKQLNPGEAAAIQTVSAEASKDLTSAVAVQQVQGESEPEHAAENPEPDSRCQLKPAGLAAGGPHQPCRTFDPDHGSDESDRDHGGLAALIPQSVASVTAGSATSGSADARTVRQGAGQQNRRDRMLQVRNRPFLVQKI